MSLKRDKICPQCESRKLWHIEKMRTLSHRHGSISNEGAPMAVQVESRWTGLKPQGQFEAFICNGCGFTEWYATGLDELKANPGEGVYFIDNEPKVGLR
jgi:hypothetical protein